MNLDSPLYKELVYQGIIPSIQESKRLLKSGAIQIGYRDENDQSVWFPVRENHSLSHLILFASTNICWLKIGKKFLEPITLE